MTCPYCEIRKESILYEDETIAVLMRDESFAVGQATVVPKKHLTIMELVDDDILKKCGRAANAVGIAIFEALGVQGTNVLIQNGLGAGQKAPHFSIDIIPRREDDGVALQWASQEADDVELATTASLLKEQEQPASIPASSDASSEKAAPEALVDNQLLANLRRIP